MKYGWYFEFEVYIPPMVSSHSISPNGTLSLSYEVWYEFEHTSKGTLVES